MWLQKTESQSSRIGDFGFWHLFIFLKWDFPFKWNSVAVGDFVWSSTEEKSSTPTVWNVVWGEANELTPST
jgi:hypothetical protein